MNPVRSRAAEVDPPSVAMRSLKAVRSNYVGTVVRIAAQFISQIFIMRTLGPELVGTFGYALLLYGVLALAIDQGFGWSLIQDGLNDPGEIATVFSRIMLVSLVCAIAVYALSSPLAQLLGNPLAGSVFRYSAPSYLLIGLFVVPQARLRAELRFGEIQSATTGAYLIAYPLVGVALALSGGGVWALVGAWYVQAVLQVLIGFYYSPHSLRLGNPFHATRSGRLGTNVTGINLLNWTVDNAGSVMVGGMGAAALGNFNAASMLARTPTLHLVLTLQPIIFSTASALRADRDKIRRMYLGALSSIGFIVIPAYAYVATHAHFVIDLLFGTRWTGAAPVLAALSLGMIALAISTLSGPILTATGGQRSVLVSQSVSLTLMLAGLFAAVHWKQQGGLFYVGLSITAAYAVALAMQVRVLTARGVVSLQEFWHAVRGPALIGLLFALPFSPLLAWLFASGIALPENARSTLFGAIELLVKSVLLIWLITKFPRMFLGDALLEALASLSFGRRLRGWLQC